MTGLLGEMAATEVRSALLIKETLPLSQFIPGGGLEGLFRAGLNVWILETVSQTRVEILAPSLISFVIVDKPCHHFVLSFLSLK